MYPKNSNQETIAVKANLVLSLSSLQTSDKTEFRSQPL